MNFQCIYAYFLRSLANRRTYPHFCCCSAWHVCWLLAVAHLLLIRHQPPKPVVPAIQRRRVIRKSTDLTLYSAQGYDSDAAKAFQQQTGIPVKLVDDSTGNLLAKISAERNNPQWDVVWFDGNVTMQTLDDQGYLLKWTSPELSNYTDQEMKVVPEDHGYYPTGITAAGVIVYNTKHIPAAGLQRPH
jgi:ABC-type thiamine transport system substrate-binding protein